MLFATIKLSLNNLRKQKMRSFLTMLGIIIGITAVILITSVIAGAESLITNQFSSLGPTLVGVLPGASDDDGPPAAVMGIVITTLTDDDTAAIAKLPHIIAASSYVSAIEAINFESQKTTATVYGVSPDFPAISDTKITNGNFFTDDDKNGMSNVAVIGSQVREELFGETDALNQDIKIKQEKFHIIGILAEQGTVGFVNMDNTVMIPISTAQKKLLGIDHVGFVRARVDDEANIPGAVEEIKYLLRDRHNIRTEAEDDFSVRAVQDALTALGTITRALQFFLIAIVSISLLVGGIGIMNIMLAAVTERIKEIGLRKAVGAQRNHIVNQFLIETIIISFTGAIIGIIIGIALAYLTSIIVNQLGYQWDFVITLFSILLSCFFAFLIGLLFGLYPARKAARLDPIEALRYE